MMMVQALMAVRITRSCTEGRASSARKANVDEDTVVAEKIAAVVLTRTVTHTEEAALEAHKVHAGVVAATKPPVEVEDVARITAKITRDAADVATLLRSTGGTTVPCASHMRLKTQKNRQMPHKNLRRRRGSRGSKRTATSSRTSRFFSETTYKLRSALLLLLLVCRCWLRLKRRRKKMPLPYTLRWRTHLFR